MTHRKKNNRSLRFESLETRKSLTTVAGVADVVSDGQAAEYSSPFAPTNRLLLFIAALEAISVERDIPDQSDADTVDRSIENTSPALL